MTSADAPPSIRWPGQSGRAPWATPPLPGGAGLVLATSSNIRPTDCMDYLGVGIVCPLFEFGRDGMTSQVDTASAAVAAAVIVLDGRVLMVRRRVAEGQLSWQFPAGKIEPGESAEAAAVRETNEEVGITVEAVHHLGERVHPARPPLTAARQPSAALHRGTHHCPVGPRGPGSSAGF
jgi:8-oxo-dGTP pyrophosphatase MutT (NUDIX family)